jgi:AP-1 complex subunit mu
VPPDVDSPAFKASLGSVTYVPDVDAIKWTIKQLYGSKEVLMRAHFGLPSVASGEEGRGGWRATFHPPSRPVRAASVCPCPHGSLRGAPSSCAEEPDADKWRKRSIMVRFEIPYFTVSGIQVRWTGSQGARRDRASPLLPLTTPAHPRLPGCRCAT